jgi:hypothetical protein
MAPTEAAVRAIIDTNLNTQTVEQFIADADLWVREELLPAGLSTDRLEAITRYLACALIRVRDLGMTAATIESATEDYQNDPHVTEYLLRAASLDPTGKIRADWINVKESTGGAGPVRFRVGSGFTTEPE